MVVEIVKGKKITEKDFHLYIGKDLKFDSIGVVDFWFEIKKEIKHKESINDFFNYLKSTRGVEEGNDFKLSEFAEYFNQKVK